MSQRLQPKGISRTNDAGRACGPRSPRRRGIPFFRLGLLLVIGSVGVSVMRFYIGFAEKAADLNSDIPTERAELWPMFQRDFLFAGSTSGWLMWGGVAIMALGIYRNLTRPR
ncbi:MAG: hypothetical protein IT432_11685 [Phycisphaerales bacterium]|nr:hypothetical protein [Phycisphaerales bacterium]